VGLSEELISQFAKITKDRDKSKKETTVYGTIVVYNGEKYVKLDGSEVMTPIMTTASTNSGDRVTVMIKNHTATVTGNLTSPSARSDDIPDFGGDISEFEIILADKVSTAQLNAESSRIDNLVSENVKIKESLVAAEADIDKLQTDKLTVLEELKAANADIDNLKTNKLDADVADLKYATAEELEATDADIHNLETTYAEFTAATTDKLDALDAKIENMEVENFDAVYANIDFSNISKATMEWFYAQSGLIKDVVIGDTTITGKLVGVTISGDLIEGNTIKAEKLVIKGTDGLYYKLNTDGVTTEAEQTDQNSLNGNIIKAKSITATKIDVDDLVAFDATIGGFNITAKAIYSGVKDSATNTTRGIYLDSEGQMAVGDSSNFIKYYKKSDGTYILEISAASVLLGTSRKSVETAINDIQSDVDSIEVGGRNLLLNSASRAITPYSDTEATHESNIEVAEWVAKDAKRLYGVCGSTSTIFATLGGTANYGASSQDQSYSATIYIKNNHATNRMTVSANHGNSLLEEVPPGGCKRVELVGLGNGWGYLQLNFKTPAAGDEFDITYWHPKIELGNRPTDWTPAPEDMATSDDVDSVASSVEANQKRITDAEALIELLTESISMLVTDGSGASLMKQTENGWTFSTGDLQDVVNRTSESLNDLTNDVNDVHNTVDILQQAVTDLGTLSEYVKIATYEGEPCIELGESDSDFKLLITNTRIMFREGTGVPAYFNNQSMHIKKAVVEEELQQGGFVWKVRANGNLGLVWKGVTS
jgi:hypothetical protein